MGMTSVFLFERLKRLELLLTAMGKLTGGRGLEGIKSSVSSTLSLKCLLVKSCIQDSGVQQIDLGWRYTLGNCSNWVAFKAVKLNKII